MVGPKKQDFWPSSTYLYENIVFCEYNECELVNWCQNRLLISIFYVKNQYTQRKPCILRIRGAPVCQKLDMILENKVV